MNRRTNEQEDSANPAEEDGLEDTRSRQNRGQDVATRLPGHGICGTIAHARTFGEGDEAAEGREGPSDRDCNQECAPAQSSVSVQVGVVGVSFSLC